MPDQRAEGPVALEGRTPLEARSSEKVLTQGTYIPLVLLRRLQSDLPGPVEAMVARDVRDWSGRHIVIPRGSVLLGAQAAQPAVGEERLLIEWSGVRRPDGSTFGLAATGAGADGSLGAAGQVDRHWMSRIGSAVALSLVGAGVQLAQPSRTLGDGIEPREIVAGEVGLSLGRLADGVLRRGIDRGPTITLEPGSRLGAVVARDLVVR